MEAVYFSKTLVNFWQTTWCHIPGGIILCSHSHDNLKSLISYVTLSILVSLENRITMEQLSCLVIPQSRFQLLVSYYEAWVHSQVDSYGICDEQPGIWTCYSQSTLVSPSELFLQSSILINIGGGGYNRPIWAQYQGIICHSSSHSYSYLCYLDSSSGSCINCWSY